MTYPRLTLPKAQLVHSPLDKYITRTQPSIVAPTNYTLHFMVIFYFILESNIFLTQVYTRSSSYIILRLALTSGEKRFHTLSITTGINVLCGLLSMLSKNYSIHRWFARLTKPLNAFLLGPLYFVTESFAHCITLTVDSKGRHFQKDNNTKH